MLHAVAVHCRQYVSREAGKHKWALTSPLHVAAGTELDDEDEEELLEADELFEAGELDGEGDGELFGEEVCGEGDGELFGEDDFDEELPGDGDGELFGLLDGEGEGVFDGEGVLFGEGEGVFDGEGELFGEGEVEAASSFVDDEQSMNLQDMLYTPP